VVAWTIGNLEGSPKAVTKMEDNLVGTNLNKAPIHLRHADLERVGGSQFKSVCPACMVGILPVRRNQEDMKIEPIDNCLLCGQTVFYDDFLEVIIKERRK